MAVGLGHALSQDTVSIADFRYPETKSIDWKGYLNGSFGQSSSETSLPDFAHTGGIPGIMTGHSSHGEFNAYTNFLFFHAKDNHDHTFQVSASGYFQHRRSDKTTIDTATVGSEDSYTQWNAIVSENWSYLHYLTDEGFHFLGSIATEYRRGVTRSSSGGNPPTLIRYRDERESYYSVDFRGSLGAGFGRLRDGTFVFRALRIIERLRDDGVITRPLSRREMLGLIDRLATEREYTTNFERSSKYFIRDIVEELTALGVVLPGSVTPFSALRILESFQERVNPRIFGWRFYYTFNDTHSLSVTEGSYDNFQNDWTYVHEFGFQFGHPLSLLTHFSGSLILDMPTHNLRNRSTVRAQTTISHQIGEQLEVVGSYGFFYGVDNVYSFDFESFQRSAAHTIEGNFVYFIEDRLRFGTSLIFRSGYTHSYGSYVRYNPVSISYSEIFFSFGLIYNII